MKYLVILIAFISTFATAQVTVGKFNSIQGDKTLTQSTLKITSPKEGDTLTNSKEILITWEGIDPNTPVDIDCFYSDKLDYIYKWIPVAKGVTGTSYKYELQKFGKHQMYLNVPIYYNDLYFRIRQSDPNFKKDRNVIKSFIYDRNVPFLAYKDKVIGFDNCSICNYNQSIRIWDAKTGLDVANLEYSGKGIWGYGYLKSNTPNSSTAFSISPDGNKLIAQSYINRYSNNFQSIFIWDLNSYKLIRTFDAESTNILTQFVTFSLDSKSIICVEENFSNNDTLNTNRFPIKVKNIQTGLVELRFNIKTEGGNVLGIKRIGDKLLILVENRINESDYFYEVWDMNDYKYLYNINSTKGNADLALNHRDGFELESTTDYSCKYLLKQEDELKLLDLTSRKDTFLIAKSYNILKELSLYNIKTIPYEITTNNDMTISSDGNKWAFFADRKIYVIDVDKKQLLFEKEFSSIPTYIYKLQFIDNESKLLVSMNINKDVGRDNITIIYDLNNKSEYSLSGLGKNIHSIVNNNSDTLIYLDNYMNIEYGKIYWNKLNNRLIAYNPLSKYDKNSNFDNINLKNIGSNNNGDILIAAEYSNMFKDLVNKIYFYDLYKSRIADSLIIQNARLYRSKNNDHCAKINTINNLAFVLQIREDKKPVIELNVYNILTKYLINKIFVDTINETSSNLVNKFSDYNINHNGKQIALRYGDSLFKICDIYTGNILKEIIVKDSIKISSFQFTNDDNYLLMTNFTGEISFWEIQSGIEKRSFQQPFKSIASYPLLSKDDKKLFTLDDYGVYVWNTESGELIRTVNPLYTSIYTMSINDDGSKLYVGELGGTFAKYNITETKYEQTLPLHTYLSYPPDSLVSDDSTFIDPINNDKPLVMSPNPSSDKIDIAYTFDEEGGTASLFVYNVFGQVILSKEIPKTKTGKYTLNLKELPIGQYVVTISSPNSIQTQNFQIMR